MMSSTRKSAFAQAMRRCSCCDRECPDWWFLRNPVMTQNDGVDPFCYRCRVKADAKLPRPIPIGASAADHRREKKKQHLREVAATFPEARLLTLMRDERRCRICGHDKGLHVHHIRARVKGGDNDLRNLISLCPSCHGKAHSGDIPAATLYRITTLYDCPLPTLDVSGRVAARRRVPR